MLWGRVIFFREVQPLKVLPSVITTPSGRFIVVRASAPLKVAGWVIFLRLLGSTYHAVFLYLLNTFGKYQSLEAVHILQ